MKIIILILLGIILGDQAKKLKIPAGAMLAPLFLMIIYNYFFKEIILPVNFRILVQIITGAYIGSKIEIKEIKEIKNILKPALIILLTMLLLNFIMVIFMVRFTGMDFVTAAFATSPGGLSDMAIIACDFGADVGKITILQLVRLLSVITIIPNLIQILLKKYDNNIVNKKKLKLKKCKKNIKKGDFIKILSTLIIGILGGTLGYLLKLPAGAMTFSMVFTAAYNLKFNKAYLPFKIKELAQVFAGVLIGSKVTTSDIIRMRTIGIPILIIVIGFILMNIILGILVYKLSNFNLATSFFSASPGGMTNISIIAEDFGADVSKVSIIQLMRLVGVIAFYPLIIAMAINILNI